MANQLNLNSTSLEALKAKAAALPEFVDTTDATATASDMLSGKTAYADGKKVTGNIPSRASSNVTASGATVTVPAGHYASQVTKSVTTASRANTTISTTANDTNDTLTYTASNNQSTGYVTGANKTATKTVTLTTSGATATMSDGTNSVSKSVTTANRAATTMSVTADDTNDKLTITASNNQSTGYVTGSNQTATKTITLTASGASVTASDGSTSVSKSVTTATQATPSVSIDSAGLITASATQSAGYVSAGTKSATKQLTTQAAKTVTPSTSEQTAVAAGVYTTGAVKVAAMPSVARADTTLTSTANDTNDTITYTASNNQGTGYVTGANKTATKTVTLTASGATITASDGTASISKSVATATQATPSISIDANGKITASATQTAGYVSAGTKTGEKQLTTQGAKTITPSTVSQTAVASGVYTTGAVTVAAMPTGNVGTPTIGVDANGKVTATVHVSAGYVNEGDKSSYTNLQTQAAKTITPTKSAQTAVTAGRYTTGAVTVAAIPDQYQDITTPLAELNAANGGTSASTINAAVDNTEAHASSQEAMIAQIMEALEGKIVEGPEPEHPYVTQATPTISVSPDGLITASATQEGGIVSAGTKTGTKQLTVQTAQTITPGTADKTISSGRYLTGTQTIKGDSNLKAENIKNGVSIFGVSGNYAGVELNFNVVGGTSKPSSPAANTLWVNTSTAITGWVFSATQPSSVTAGTIWFKTQASSFLEFNALKNNGIYVYPVLASQLENGTWVSKDFQLYSENAWQTSDLIIFDGTWHYGYSLNAGWNCTVNNNANPAIAQFTNGHSSTWIYVDVTNYKTVEVEFAIVQSGWTTLSLSTNGDAGDNAEGSVYVRKTGTVGKNVFTLPLDSLTGGYYLKFHSWQNSARTLEVYSIKFLK